MRWRSILGWGGLALLAAYGTAALGYGMSRVAPLYENDLIPLAVTKAWLAGQSVHVAFGPGHIDAYPLPMELLLLPIAAVSDPVRVPLVKLLCLALLPLALTLWAEGRSRRPVLILMLAAPGATLIVHDHLITVLGVLAFSVAVRAERHERFFVAGIALGIGAFRLGNLLPVAAMIAVGLGPRWNAWLRCGAGLLLVIVPLSVTAFALDPVWMTDWQADLRLYPEAGLVRLVTPYGLVGVLVAQTTIAAVAALVVRRSWGRPLDLDGASLGLALSVLMAPMEGIYSSLPVLPAVLRAGYRRGYARIPAVTAVGSWLPIVAVSPWLVVYAPAAALGGLTAIIFWMLLNTYPILRRATPHTASTAS